MTVDKCYNLIYSKYNKKLLAEHKANFSVLDNGLSYFTTYLKMLRDHYILMGSYIEDKASTELKVASLAAAVNEFDSYQNCVSKYYRLNGNTVEHMIEGTEEDVAKKYDSERKFHWINFWQLVMANIESWAANG